MTGGCPGFVIILCANSGDADRGAPIDDGSLRRLLFDACDFQLAIEGGRCYWVS